MGGTSSKYKLSVTSTASGIDFNDSPSDWIAKPSAKLNPLKHEIFSITGALGKGKFGFVFLCKFNKSSKHVAVKYISKNVIMETESFSRLQQEADINEKTEHPFIAHCFGGFETPSCIALVFEYAFGGELFTQMKKQGKFSENEAKFYFSEIALAIHYLHNKLGIVYRDLKPENVLIDNYGHLKLCDFGFAVIAGTETGLELEDGCGTAMYVAPEIAAGFMKQPHGFPVDWWSLGCVLYEMVTGNAPFGDTDKMSKFEIFNNITTRNIILPYSISTPLKILLKQLLEKSPEKRNGWEQTKSALWCADIPWLDVINKRVKPPWIPAYSAQPTFNNFVRWTFEIPKDVSSAATSYCSSLKYPRTRSSTISEFDISGQAAVGGSLLSLHSGDGSGSPTPKRSVTPSASPMQNARKSSIKKAGDMSPLSKASSMSKIAVDGAERPGAPLVRGQSNKAFLNK